MDERLRVVLLGSPGNGKSATGNTMLGKNIFMSKISSSPVTSECQVGQNSQLLVVDTPGFYDTRDKKYEKDIARCIALSSPGPHLFMFVIRPGRFTECEQRAVASIKETFGPRVVDFMIIVLVKKDEINAKTDREKFIANSPVALKVLIKECGGRYAFIENEPKQDDKDQTLVDLIRRTSRNGELYYTNEMYENAMADVLEVQEATKKDLAKKKEEQRRALESEIRDELELKMRTQRLDREFDVKMTEAAIAARKADTVKVVWKATIIGVAAGVFGGAAACAVGAAAPAAAAIGGVTCAVVTGVKLTPRLFSTK